MIKSGDEKVTSQKVEEVMFHYPGFEDGSGAPPVEDDPMVTFRLFKLQEPEAPFQNATPRDWQKATPTQRELWDSAAG
jgi:hypothetical protein